MAHFNWLPSPLGASWFGPMDVNGRRSENGRKVKSRRLYFSDSFIKDPLPVCQPSSAAISPQAVDPLPPISFRLEGGPLLCCY